MTTSEKFKTACQAKGWSAAKVAEMTGLSMYTIYAYFQGVRYPSRRTKRILAERLEGIEINTIFDE